MNTNSLILTGRLTRDPEFRVSKNDQSVAKGNLAVNGKNDEDVIFVTFYVFGKNAENFKKLNIFKGTFICLQGRLTQYSFDDKKSSEANKITITYMIVDKFEKLSKKDENLEVSPQKKNSNEWDQDSYSPF